MTPKKRHEEEVSIDIDSADAPSTGGFGTDDSEPDSAAPLAKIQKLKQELAAAKAEAREYLDGWQRLKADVANMRKNDTERQARNTQAAQEAILEDLLPIIDNFDMARAGAAWQAVDANWRIGVEAIISQIEQLIARYGATRIGAVGEAFDPRLHEAVSETKAASAADDDTITAVLRSGWRVGDAILRPAQVSVARH